jgi:hypothetical protein
MVEHRKFRVVLVADAHGVGVEVTNSANADIAYDGKEMQATIR